MSEVQTYGLSDQALGALMMALQRSLMEQSDIVETLRGFEFVNSEAGLEILNPPIIRVPNNQEEP